MISMMAVKLIILGGIYINPNQIIFLDWAGEHECRLVYGVGTLRTSNFILVKENCHKVAQVIAEKKHDK